MLKIDVTLDVHCRRRQLAVNPFLSAWCQALSKGAIRWVRKEEDISWLLQKPKISDVGGSVQTFNG